MTARNLADYLEASAARWPDRPAVVEPSGRSVSYAELNQQADALARFFIASGVKRGDRVGIVLPKSAEAVAALFGVMKAGAAYVPVDYSAPPERARGILTDCQIRALVVDHQCLAVTPDRAETLLAAVIVVGSADSTTPTSTTSIEKALRGGGDAVTMGGHDNPEELAYILYTSGSTGIPKGVMLSHENAISFVDWCSTVFEPTEEDRFSSHAPFHFDLSVLDIYVAMKHGATLYLVSEDLGKNPKGLARFIAVHRLTIWYSTPSILTLLVQLGHLDIHDASSLRLVLFAGEVFPVKHLRALQRQWPQPTYYNLYGPTETNVCTFARVPARIPDDREVPYPIGVPCSHCQALVLDGNGSQVADGDEGLLYISGASVFSGYWNRPVENADAFLELNGARWYNTGDVVRWQPGEGFIYIGRKDRMVKRRGYRIELGEIERALYLHSRVGEAAVVSIPDADTGVQIVAFLSSRETETPSIFDLKTFCGKTLPAYMSPDRFVFRDRLPRTSTDKVDYQALRQSLLGPDRG